MRKYSFLLSFSKKRIRLPPKAGRSSVVPRVETPVDYAKDPDGCGLAGTPTGDREPGTQARPHPGMVQEGRDEG